MAYNFDAAKAAARNFGSTAWNAVPSFKNLVDNRVVNFVKPYFSQANQLIQPYVGKAYNALPEPVKAHSYIWGGAGTVLALVGIRALFSKPAKPPANPAE